MTTLYLLHFELIHQMTWWQLHSTYLSRVPSGDYVSPTERIIFQLLYDMTQLIHVSYSVGRSDCKRC